MLIGLTVPKLEKIDDWLRQKVNGGSVFLEMCLSLDYGTGAIDSFRLIPSFASCNKWSTS